MSVTAEDDPIPRPRWLIIYCLHKECLEIFNRMQSQPNSELDWSLLRWANQTIDLIPELEDESNWDESIPIPPGFTLNKTNQETAASTLYDMVTKFFLIYNCLSVIFECEKTKLEIFLFIVE